MEHIKLTQEVLSVDGAVSLATHPSCGAVSLFLGTTRDTFLGKDVIRLEYEAYNVMAEKEMRSLCKQAREKWSLKHIVLHHRLGVVPVTETSVIVAVSSEHRRESLDAVSFLIDALKAKVPIWKKEVYKDGSGDWKKNIECVWDSDNNIEVEETSNNNKRSMRGVDERDNDPHIKKSKEEFEPKAVSSGEHASNVPGNSITHTSKVDNLQPDEKPAFKNLCDYHKLDPKYIQIVASKQEITRRIVAFQQRKREEVDMLNVQEFCSLAGGESLGSCARTTAVVLTSKGSNTHLKLTRVVNEWGPQTVGMDPSSLPTNITAKGTFQQEGGNNSRYSSREGSVESKCPAKESFSRVKCKTGLDLQESELLPTGVEERIRGLESHLRIMPGGAVPKKIYTRIKALEDRVLFLEGISLEYFSGKCISAPATRSKMMEIKAFDDDISLDELDMKIHNLKMKLKQKQLKQGF